jgi:hypothetical protein
MHPDCAEAATRLCPHFAHRRPARSTKISADTITPPGFIMDKPEVWVMGITRTYTIVVQGGGVIFLPAPFHRTRRFSYDHAGHLQEEKPPPSRPAARTGRRRSPR